MILKITCNRLKEKAIVSTFVRIVMFINVERYF